MGKSKPSDPNYLSVLQGLYLFPGIVGNLYFVSSLSGSASGPGWAPENAFATLGQALAACTPNNGDVILLCPGHTETLTAASGVLVNVAGVTIVSLGNGRNRAVFNYTTSTAASFDITAANVTVRNVVFNPTGIDAVIAAINVTGIDCVLDTCEMQISSGTAGVVKGILTAATATRLRVENCRFIGPATSTGTTTTACIDHEAGIDYVIRNNEFTGKMTQAITNTATVLGGKIHGNTFVIATGTKAVNMAAASTPFIVNNWINVPSGTAPIVSAAGFVAGNAYSAAAGVTAPAASTF